MQIRSPLSCNFLPQFIFTTPFISRGPCGTNFTSLIDRSECSRLLYLYYVGCIYIYINKCCMPRPNRENTTPKANATCIKLVRRDAALRGELFVTCQQQQHLRYTPDSFLNNEFTLNFFYILSS